MASSISLLFALALVFCLSNAIQQQQQKRNADDGETVQFQQTEFCESQEDSKCDFSEVYSESMDNRYFFRSLTSSSKYSGVLYGAGWSQLVILNATEIPPRIISEKSEITQTWSSTWFGLAISEAENVACAAQITNYDPIQVRVVCVSIGMPDYFLNIANDKTLSVSTNNKTSESKKSLVSQVTLVLSKNGLNLFVGIGSEIWNIRVFQENVAAILVFEGKHHDYSALRVLSFYNNNEYLLVSAQGSSKGSSEFILLELPSHRNSSILLNDTNFPFEKVQNSQLETPYMNRDEYTRELALSALYNSWNDSITGEYKQRLFISYGATNSNKNGIQGPAMLFSGGIHFKNQTTPENNQTVETIIEAVGSVSYTDICEKSNNDEGRTWYGKSQRIQNEGLLALSAFASPSQKIGVIGNSTGYDNGFSEIRFFRIENETLCLLSIARTSRDYLLDFAISESSESYLFASYGDLVDIIHNPNRISQPWVFTMNVVNQRCFNHSANSPTTEIPTSTSSIFTLGPTASNTTIPIPTPSLPPPTPEPTTINPVTSQSEATMAPTDVARSSSKGSPALEVFLIIGLIVVLTVVGVGILFLFQRWQKKNVGYISLIVDNNI